MNVTIYSFRQKRGKWFFYLKKSTFESRYAGLVHFILKQKGKNIMKTKDMIISAILLAIGTMLHFVIPGVVAGIKPDFLLATMFIAIFINPDLKNVTAIAIVGGLLAALTTGFPGGQIPSILDKFVSAYAVFFLAQFFVKGEFHIITVGVFSFIGTLISGAVFLFAVMIFASLPAGIGTLFLSIVIPTAVANVFVAMVLFKSFASAKKLATR